MNADEFNKWFNLLFPPLMILMFPVMSWFVRRRPESDEAAATARRTGFWMHVIAIASLAAFFVARAIFGAHEVRMMWLLCFLQMPLWQRHVAARNASWGSPYATTTRVAPLTNRERKTAVPTQAWIIAWFVWALLAAIAAWGYVVNEIPSRLGMLISMFTLGPALFLAYGPKMVRMVAYEPEPMDPHNSPELQAAYEKHRHARMWMFFALPISMAAIFCGCAIAVAWLATSIGAEQRIGLYGGMAGAFFGILGGAVGTYFGCWRARLNQMVREMSAEQKGAADRGYGTPSES
jgi:hypothetical protein